MKTQHLLLAAGALAAAFVAFRSVPTKAATTQGAGYVPLNSGVYNPIFNPGGSTNYIGSFLGQTPATGRGFTTNEFGAGSLISSVTGQRY